MGGKKIILLMLTCIMLLAAACSSVEGDNIPTLTPTETAGTTSEAAPETAPTTTPEEMPIATSEKTVDPHAEDYKIALELCASGDLDGAYAIFETMPEGYGEISKIKAAVEPYMNYVGDWRLIASKAPYDVTYLETGTVTDSYLRIKLAYIDGEICLLQEFYSSSHATHPLSTAVCYHNERDEFESCYTTDVGTKYMYHYIEGDHYYDEDDLMTIMYERIED